MTGSDSDRPVLDFEHDIPTTPEDSAVLWKLSNRLDVTPMTDVNRLVDPRWTLERALQAPFFSDRDEPFEL